MAAEHLGVLRARRARLWASARRLVAEGHVTEAEAAGILGPPPPADELAAAEASLTVSRPDAPADGPGTELTAIYASVGLAANCASCKEWAARMNHWGPDGCRRNFETLVGRQRDAARELGWGPALAKAARHPVALAGLAARVNWADPFPDIVRLAIDRAEAKAVG